MSSVDWNSRDALRVFVEAWKRNHETTAFFNDNAVRSLVESVTSGDQNKQFTFSITTTESQSGNDFLRILHRIEPSMLFGYMVLLFGHSVPVSPDGDPKKLLRPTLDISPRLRRCASRSQLVLLQGKYKELFDHSAGNMETKLLCWLPFCGKLQCDSRDAEHAKQRVLSSPCASTYVRKMILSFPKWSKLEVPEVGTLPENEFVDWYCCSNDPVGDDVVKSAQWERAGVWGYYAYPRDYAFFEKVLKYRRFGIDVAPDETLTEQHVAIVRDILRGCDTRDLTWERLSLSGSQRTSFALICQGWLRGLLEESVEPDPVSLVMRSDSHILLLVRMLIPWFQDEVLGHDLAPEGVEFVLHGNKGMDFDDFVADLFLEVLADYGSEKGGEYIEENYPDLGPWFSLVQEFIGSEESQGVKREVESSSDELGSICDEFYDLDCY